jgi:hypothetical protein
MMICNILTLLTDVKGKGNPITDLDRPWGFQEVEAPRFQDNRHMKVARLSALRTGHLYPPRKYSWYSFLLEAESTPGPQCGQKDYVNEKFQWHHRESNPRPSDCKIPQPPRFKHSKWSTGFREMQPSKTAWCKATCLLTSEFTWGMRCTVQRRDTSTPIRNLRSRLGKNFCGRLSVLSSSLSTVSRTDGGRFVDPHYIHSLNKRQCGRICLYFINWIRVYIFYGHLVQLIYVNNSSFKLPNKSVIYDPWYRTLVQMI